VSEVPLLSTVWYGLTCSIRVRLRLTNGVTLRSSARAAGGVMRGAGSLPSTFVLQKVFIQSFCKGQFPHKFVNLSFIITNMENKLTDLWGNWLLQNDYINTSCEINPGPHSALGCFLYFDRICGS